MKLALVAGALACTFAAAAVWRGHLGIPHFGGSENGPEDPKAAFELVSASEGTLDGSPALTLTFSLPLDSAKDYARQIDVFEMTPSIAKAAKAAADDTDQADQADQNDQGGGVYSEGDGEHGEQAPPPKVSEAVSKAPADVATQGGKRVGGAWIVSTNPRLLQFPHTNPNSRYVVVAHADLASPGGKKLGRAISYSIRTAEMAPTLYFASNGMVLPAKQNGGLPVVTVNVPEVDVEFLRVKPDQLPRFLDRVITAAKSAQPEDPDAAAGGQTNGDNYFYRRNKETINLHGNVYGGTLNTLDDMSESIYHGRFLTDARKNRRGVTFLPVETVKQLAEPGVYVAVMTRPGHFENERATTYFYVTDLGLSVRQFDKSADVFVSSLRDAKAVADVDISWLDKRGAVLASARTDGNGHASFGERPQAARVLMARKGSQIAMITVREPALDLSEYPVSGESYRPSRLFVYSGRDLYRPGERFDVSVQMRDADGRAVAPQPIQASLRRADGRTQFVSSWRPDARYPGFFRQTIELPADAPTGMWTLELRADPADKTPGGTMAFHVEEFLPERMKLDLASEQATLAFGENFDIDATGAYLFGAPAAGNRLLGDVSIEPRRNPLPEKVPGFFFGDVDAVALKIKAPEETTLDKEGKAQVSLELPKAKQVQTPYAVKATLTLLESGGRPLIRSIERVVWPAPALVGVRPLFGDYASEGGQAEFEVLRVDRDGKTQPVKGLPVRLIRENRDFYWRFNSERGWFSGFNQTDELVETANVDVPAGGRGKLHFGVKWGSYRLEVTDPATHMTLRHRFSAGWSFDASQEDAGVRPDRVGLMLDKDGYANGETAKLSVTAPHHGEAIVTVEGDRLLWSKRVRIDQDKQVVELPIAADWKRHDLYATVTVLRPGKEGDRITPARALGIIPLPLARAERRLAVTLAAPDKVRPETTVPVKVKVPDARGQKAMLTLSAVDVGILNITQYKSPDPWRFFFGQLRYGADLHDVYGRLIEKMAGEQGKLKFGGDSGNRRAKPSGQQKVRLVDVFSGPVMLDANGEATVPVSLPDFNGKVRLMAVVTTQDHFGSAERDTTVAAPLVAELNTPRFITFNDQASLALDLHNLSGSKQQLKVVVSGDDALKVADGQRNVALAQLEKTTLRLGLVAGANPGLHTLRVQVEGQGIHIDRKFMLEVEAPVAPRQLSTYQVVEPGQTVTLKPDGLAGLYQSTVMGHLLVSDQPPIDIKRIVEGLLVYPYGCVEQTISASYPYLYVDEALAKRAGLKVYSREERAARVEHALARLAGMQARGGGFSLWGGEERVESWISAYAVAFMQDAREQGFTVPDAMYQIGIDYLLRDLQEGDSGLAAQPPGTVQPLRKQNYDANAAHYHGWTRSEEALVFQGFVLARANKAPLAALRDLFERRDSLRTPLAKVQLGIAFKLMGDAGRAATVLKEAVKTVRQEPRWWWYAWDYGSEIRDIAQSYGLMERYKVKQEGADQWLIQLADKLRGNHYLSTQEQMAVFLTVRGLAEGKHDSWQATAGTREIKGSGALVVDLDPAAVGASSFTNRHSAKLYVTQTATGVPKEEPKSTGHFQFDRTMYEPNGTVIHDRALKVGETVIVEVDVWPTNDYQTATALVVDRVPAGLEIENLNLVKDSRLAQAKFADVDAEEAMRNPNIQHVEFRDDRFVVALRLGQIYWNSSKPVALFYQARVVTPGQFVVPGTHAEDMYNAEIVDDGPLKHITVVNGAPAKGALKSEADTATTEQ
ncbi:MAG: alpha-2-macroglobulin [Pseudomonadota bacterium]